jgi:hypothetical protein
MKKEEEDRKATAADRTPIMNVRERIGEGALGVNFSSA